MATYKLTLKKGLAGKIKKNKKIISALGLHKIGDSKEYAKTPALEGMVKKVGYLLTVEEK